MFASDAITLGDRLTLNVGLRFDHSRAISQDLPALDPQGRETDTMIAGLGTLYTWNIVSPRLGVATKLSADGRTMLRASYGRFSQGVLTGEFGSFHTGVSPITTRGFDAAAGGYTTLVSVVDPKVQLQLDPEIRAPHSDQYSVGVDREVGRRLRVLPHLPFDRCNDTAICPRPHLRMTIDTIPHPCDKFRSCRGASV